MRILILSDVHGNLVALEKLLNTTTVDFYINLGDVVNYGPWSNECVELMLSLDNCINIRGNHEEYFINDFCDVQNDLVVAFFNHCIEGFKYKEAIKDFDEEASFDDFSLRHTLGKKDYVFNDTDVSIYKNLMIGHSHQQYIRHIEGFILLNPGSIGQNRSFINVSEYIIWDSEKNNFCKEHLVFDFDKLISKMKSLRYPQECIDYYSTKRQYH